MAGEALSRAGEQISVFRLVPGPHGKFDIRVNGELVAEHKHLPDAHIFPDLQDPMRAVSQRMTRATAGARHTPDTISSS